MKKNIYHTVETVPQSNGWKTVERGKLPITHIYIHDL